MEWVRSLNEAIDFIESHLNDDISVEDVVRHVYASSSHFQFIFHVVMGITVGEYIRNRRLSVAARELLDGDAKIIDVAMSCWYDTQESFSKAFTRFHGVPPSKIRRDNVKTFEPLSINIRIEGGFVMNTKFTDEFVMVDWLAIERETGVKLTGAEKYKKITDWARKARGQNPSVFDAISEWILDDSQWTPEQLAENEQILLGGVFKRFADQNARLRAYLNDPELKDIVNPAVFGALDEFDAQLAGRADERVRAAVERMFADFSVMSDRGARELIAGEKTGPTGTDSVNIWGYVNSLKNCDAQVQWTLFMPDLVKQQQDGFKVVSFEYKKLPALRFIGKEGENREDIFAKLDELREFDSEFNYDLLFMHHCGLGVDVGEWHGLWGRFMRADAPVPEGFEHIDLIVDDDKAAGAPFISQFAFAKFEGDSATLHKREGYDSDAMYDVTRNIILGQSVIIPYPTKYWTAEAFLDGWRNPGAAYLFSVIL